MATKTASNEYKYIGDYPRGENGKVVKKGDVVNLGHLEETTIKRLIQMGYYKEVK